PRRGWRDRRQHPHDGRRPAPYCPLRSVSCGRLSDGVDHTGAPHPPRRRCRLAPSRTAGRPRAARRRTDCGLSTPGRSAASPWVPRPGFSPGAGSSPGVPVGDARAPADPALPLDIEVDAATIVAAVGSPPGPVAPPHQRTATDPPARSDELTDHQRSILDFERLWWRRPGAKEQAIRDNFEMSPTPYYQPLNHLT